MANRKSDICFRHLYKRKHYGLSNEQLAQIENLACAICGGIGNNIDHCHASNQFRGVLCFNCNIGIGYFKDSPSRLRSAAAYLEAFMVAT
jgi:hypothetical protein